MPGRAGHDELCESRHKKAEKSSVFAMVVVSPRGWRRWNRTTQRQPQKPRPVGKPASSLQWIQRAAGCVASDGAGSDHDQLGSRRLLSAGGGETQVCKAAPRIHMIPTDGGAETGRRLASPFGAGRRACCSSSAWRGKGGG